MNNSNENNSIKDNDIFKDETQTVLYEPITNSVLDEKIDTNSNNVDSNIINVNDNNIK